MQLINEQEWQALPEPAQQEVYCIFLLINQGFRVDNNRSFRLH